MIYANSRLTDLDPAYACISGAAFTNFPAHIDGLNPGHRYLVAPVSWNAVGAGLPEIVHDVLIGCGGAPPTPSALQIIANDLTTFHVTWTQCRALPTILSGRTTTTRMILRQRTVNSQSRTPAET